MIDALAQKIFGLPIAFQMRLTMLRQISSESGLVCRKIWFGKWSLVTRSLLKMLLSASVIDYGYKSDSAIRAISTVFSNCDLKPYLPPYNLSLRAQDESTFMSGAILAKAVDGVKNYLYANNCLVNLNEAFHEVSATFFTYITKNWSKIGYFSNNLWWHNFSGPKKQEIFNV